jgi:hypothetical protein
MTINGQTVYATLPPPGTPTSAPPRVAYHIQPGGQFAYTPTQQPQQSQQNQQWIAIQPTNMQFSGQPRIIAQPVQRNIGTHRFPSGYTQNQIQGPMVYTANVPGSPHPQRIPVRPQIVTTQTQQPSLQQPPHTSNTPTTPANLQTPGTHASQATIMQQTSGGYYGSSTQGYPSNFSGQVSFTQQKHQTPPVAQPPAARQFHPTNNGQGFQLSQPLSNSFSSQSTINGSQQRATGNQPQQIRPGHFPSRAPQTGVNKQIFEIQANSIISPNQQVQILASSTIQSHNINQLVPRPQQPVQHRIAPQIFYSEVQNNVPPELCFAGCYFVYTDPNSSDLHTLIRMIRYCGGDLDAYNNRGAPEKATHIICDYGAHIPQVLEQKNKRLCTVAWINDIIEKRKIEPPYKVCHLPSLLIRQTTMTEKVISVTGFNEREAANIKFMIQVIGAKFNPYLSKHTNVLIAKSSNSPKVEKAVKAFNNSIQIVNLSWLCDLYIGFGAPLNDITNRKYSVSNITSLEIGPVNLSKLHENVARMMLPWQYPLTITDEHLKRSTELRSVVINDETVFASVKYVKLFAEGVVPNDEQIDKAVKFLKQTGTKPDIQIAFSGFNHKELNILSRKIKLLGVEVVDKVEDCHFLIAPFLVRSASILKAIAAGKDIISPLWVIACFNQLKIIKSDDFLLRDVNAEKTLQCNLRHTLIEARLYRIFENICFYVSPSVKPNRQDLQSIIEAGGGIVDKVQPSRFALQKYLEEERLYIIISSQCDLVFFQAFTEKNIPIFSEEFIFCAIMRHKIDTSNFFVINLAQSNQRTGNSKAPAISAQKNSLNSYTSQIKA